MSRREEVLDMAVHALTALMNRDREAEAADLFDEAVMIGEKLVDKVEETVAAGGTPPRDEMVDMGIHALSALLNGRQPANVDAVLDESMAAAQAIVARVDAELGEDADDDAREELLDVAVHVQTALLNARPQMSSEELSDRCVSVARALLARIDAGPA